ncbi:MAG TPA: hypothetical protein DCL48_07160, partial [Alphaproteobacteria bacterium]|nr:hypothetical protein [Alphaproteobacteria bacterium]
MGALTAIGARLSAALMICILTSAAIAAPGAEVYGGKPDISGPELSPDGTMVAALVPRGDDVAVRISKLGTTKACDYVPQGSKARNVFWANNNQAVLEVSFFYAPGKTRQALRFTTEVYRYLSINTSCDVSAELLRDHPQYGIVAGFNFLGRAGGGNELIFSALTISQTGDTLDIYKVDATTGKSTILEKGKSTTTAWYVDGSGTPRLRGDRTSRDSTFTVSARLTGSNDWTEVYTSTSTTPDAQRMGFMGLASKADIAYVSTRNGGDREAIYEYDLRAKALGRQVFAHARYDAGGIVLDDYSRTPIGVSYTDDHLRVQYFDRTYAQRQADVAATFPGEVVRIEGASADGTRYLTYVEGVENPGGVYHLVDQKLNDMSLIGARYPSIRA